MTDETKKPDEIDQAALDAHPEEQTGNAAGGASSEEQPQDSASAPAATDGDAGEQGNVSAPAVIPAAGADSVSNQSSNYDSATNGSQASGSVLGGSSTASTDGTQATDAGNAAGAATDGAQQAGDAPVGGGDVPNVSGSTESDSSISSASQADSSSTQTTDEGSSSQTADSTPTSPISASTATDSAQSPSVHSSNPSSAATSLSDESSVSSADSALPLGAGGVVVPVADHVPEDDAQLAAADKAGATVEDNSGNVVAGGAPAVVTSSPASDTPTIDPNSDEHPIKTRARWLRMKFEAEEAVVMEHIVELLRDIEETL